MCCPTTGDLWFVIVDQLRNAGALDIKHGAFIIVFNVKFQLVQLMVTIHKEIIIMKEAILLMPIEIHYRKANILRQVNIFLK